MLHPSKKIKKQYIIYMLLMLFFAFNLSAQNQKKVPDIEKIYLHTDRDAYMLGESLWYKAYVVYAYNNLLFDKSSVLYVDLISEDNKVVLSNKTRLEQGLGNGDFILTDSLGVQKPGKYQLRAYTNWNRNFEESLIFKKNIEILDVFNYNMVDNDKSKKSAKNKSRNSIENSYSVNFFPEGGSLLENVASVVAFKAEDAFGNPIKVQGELFDEADNLVTLFVSLHDGMGKFQFKPLPNKTYYAKIKTSNQTEIKIDLPKPIQQGYVLASRMLKDKHIITIKTNNKTLKETGNAPVTLVCNTRGIAYFEGSQPLNSNNTSFELPTENFPEGISQLTLYDASQKPQSERLVYIEKPHDLNVSLSTNKTSYQPNEEVVIQMTSKDSQNQTVPASFSLSVSDQNGRQAINDYTSNICSYFLMESDIKGRVNNPGFYFDANNSKRLVFLDLLLLTQGWRDFLWKHAAKTHDNLIFKAEKGLEISGHVKQLFGSKNKPDSNVTLSLLNDDGIQLFHTLTDSLGAFNFNDLVFTGKTTMMLNTSNQKGKGRGMFILDSVPELPVMFDYKLDVEDTTNQNSLKEAIYKKYMMYGVPPENVLAAVEITASKKDDVPQSMYGFADNTFVVDDKTLVYSDIFQFIQFNVPGVSVMNNQLGFSRYGGQPAQILVDGVQWDQESVRNMQAVDVAKIEAFKGPNTAIFGGQGGNGVIVIYTKRGEVNIPTKPSLHSITQIIDGYYNARTFFSPTPDKLNVSTENDIRNTLYWNPYVFPDENKPTTLKFYNSKVETTVKVELQGLTGSGIPVVKTVYYTVEQ
ncbi:hypothetical protein PK35_04695 [Tamlana nanhaiensis]|uniref:TonB-dependent receptor plug domain-containing protein n=1 Tax=Neotamlana nanhaiensis TaxID=1382798 RepID=A0A0D7W4J5_9FLAO|nr:Plug domain-containing protein [Tamlana nanhaiensis]KJD34036.1 hypothetical protein PK35_04695 [Tamlana nanhaiensis]